MPSWKRQTCQRKTLSACAVTSLVLLVGLLLFVVIYLMLSWQHISAEHLQDLTFDLNDDCRSKASVVTDEALMPKCDPSMNFSQAWSNAEQEAREPAHEYMEKHHSAAIYMNTKNTLLLVQQGHENAKRCGKPLKETVEARSLYRSLSEAIQILKHGQVTCRNTRYRKETFLQLNISNSLVRFSTFILGSDEWNFTGNASCFEVYTCFGADITYYSALKLNSQVLIPPYEVFRVTSTERGTERCKVIYRLQSHLNCVYDKESNRLHPISALPMVGFWLIFAIVCMIIVALLLPYVIVKVLENHKKTDAYRACTHYPAVIQRVS